jgi:membrane fusion protein (multidrug efflux system)
VQSGPVLGEEVVVYEGVKAGEQIATSGSFKLRESVLVAIADPKQQAAGTEGEK